MKMNVNINISRILSTYCRLLSNMELEAAIARKPRDRGMNWGLSERTVLVQLVLANEAELFGKFKGSGLSHKDKEAAWVTLTAELNAEAHSKRSVDQVKKQFDNIKQQVKKYLDGVKYPRTGGGPAPPSPTIPQKLLIQRWEHRASMTGIAGGLDTESTTMEDTVVLCNVLGLEEASECCSTALASQFQCLPISTADVGMKKKKKKESTKSSLKSLEDAEVERAKMESKLARMRTVWERRRMKAEIAYWEKKTEML